jgi:hypothetical protein
MWLIYLKCPLTHHYTHGHLVNDEDATPTQRAFFESMSPIRTQAIQLIDDFNSQLLVNGLTLIDPGTGESTL